MTLPLERRAFTPEEYLWLERKSEYKSEYVDGQIYAHAGASEPHNLIVAQTIAEFSSQLKGKPCRVYPSDIRVWLESINSYVYPDVTVLCGEPDFYDDRKDTILNPQIIVEVMSPSSESYDRTTKSEGYRSLASLTTYILIAQDKPLIEVFERQEDERWLLSSAKGLEASVDLSHIGCTLKLADVYAFVKFG